MIDANLIEFMRPYLKDSIRYTAKTSINQDLGIKGEKAKLFMKHFSEAFKVNISYLEFDKYFSENLNNDDSLTIEDLNRSIFFGSLDETTINFREDGTEFEPKFALNKIIQGVIIFIVCAILLCFVAFYT